MNDNPIYEQLIAQKLQQLPVPDMADAIWARIEMQLDNDMPTDDTNNSPSTPPSPIKPLRKTMGWLTAIIAVIAIIVINKQRQQTQPAPTPYVIEQQQTIPSAQSNKPDNPLPAPVNKNTVMPGVITPGNVDSVSSQQNIPAPINTVLLNDSVNNVLPPVVNQQPQLIQAPVTIDSTPVKKRRGAQGITDKDYRIVPDPKKP